MFFITVIQILRQAVVVISSKLKDNQLQQIGQDRKQRHGILKQFCL